MEIKRRIAAILGTLDFDPRKRRSVEKTLVQESGAEDICIAVTNALGMDPEKLQGKILYMNGMRAGLNINAGVFFIDEPRDLERQIGVKSNGVHVEMYEIANRETPGGVFNQRQTPVPPEYLVHFIKVAEWLRSPRFDIRRYPLEPKA